jgi:hypothetical protein
MADSHPTTRPLVPSRDHQDTQFQTIVDRAAEVVDRNLLTIIRANHLKPCVFVAVFCVTHDFVRLICRHAPSGKQTRCPACGELSNFLILGEGGTRTPLPFWKLPEGL